MSNEFTEVAREMYDDFREFAGEVRHLEGVQADYRTWSIGSGLAIYGFAAFYGKTGVGRGDLPEPFDLANHLGNFGPSVFVGTMVGSAVMGACEMEDEILGTEYLQSPSRLKAGLLAGGLAAGALVNWYAESSYGVSLHYEDATNHVDFIDWVYGVIGTVIGSRAVARFRRESA